MHPASRIDDRSGAAALHLGDDHDLLPTHTLGDGTAQLRDYYELTKPRLNFMVLVTTFVGYAIASRNGGASMIDWTLPATLIGTAMTAASAAVLNQTVEREHDAKMRRTSNRPIAAGRLTAVEGTIFGATLGVVGVGLLALAVNPLTALLGFITWATYLLIYTPLKRRSWTNTLVGAITGALPPAMGVTAVSGAINPLAASLFAILFVWQMPHFYALALRYRDDYAAGGFCMLPNCADGDRRTRVQAVVYAALLLPVSLVPLSRGVSHAGWAYGIGATLLGLFFLRAAIRCAARRPDAERNLFLASISYLPLLLIVLMADQ